MLRVRIITDTVSLQNSEEHHPDALLPFLQDYFNGSWPETARLYRDDVAVENDCTPATEDDVLALEDADGLFYVVVYPGDPVTAIITTFVAVLALAAVIYVLTPKIPALEQRNNQASSNNELGERTNKPRINGRIPDIFGTVISVPESLTVPYRVFRDGKEYEAAYMCIGRGSYDVAEVKDDATPVSQIPGTSVRVYGPNTSPNSGTAQLSIGPTITEPFLAARRITAVNGQTLEPGNFNGATALMRFIAPDTIEKGAGANTFDTFLQPGDRARLETPAMLTASEPTATVIQSAKFSNTTTATVTFETYDPTGAALAIGTIVELFSDPFTVYYDLPPEDPLTYPKGLPEQGMVQYSVNGRYRIAGVTSNAVTLVSLSGAAFSWTFIDTYYAGETAYQNTTLKIYSGAGTIDLNGVYTVDAVAPNTLKLLAPEDVNDDWSLLSGTTGYAYSTVTSASDTTVGPFTLDVGDLAAVYFNFVANNGLYKDDGTNQVAASVTIRIGLTPLDGSDSQSGPEEVFVVTLTGSSSNKDAVGVTYQANPSFTGRCRVTVQRTTPKDTAFKGTVVDEVKWRDLYAMTPITVPHFGDVTTVWAVTQATTGATAIKERRLNCRVTRRVSVRNPDNTFGPTLAASQNAADILCHVALDPHIGGRTLAELDVPQIYETLADVVDYFGIPDAGRFCYTFDQDDLSFEEIAKAIAQAVFCTPYRQGNRLKLQFERETEDSVLLFNHRNKLPGSETRTLRFGTLDDIDGIEFDYVSPRDGAKLTLYLPEDRTAVRPKKQEVIGVSSERAARLHALRSYNKMKFQHTTTQFDALGEATQLVINERIEVTDNTRPDVSDGYIVAVDGLSLTLSQPFVPVAGRTYTFFRQLPSGGVETLPVVGNQENAYKVILQSAPSEPFVLDEQASADVTYQIVGDDVSRSSAFLLTEKGSYDKRSLQLTAINYDSRYYAGDGTYRG